MATKLIAPRTGEGVEELTITNWLKNVGDKVEEMESILEIETDKVVTEFPSPVAGTLLRIDVPAGSTVKVGESMGLVGDPNESLEEGKPSAPAEEKASAPAEKQSAETAEGLEAASSEAVKSAAEQAEVKKEPIPSEPEKPETSGEKSAFISPLVRKMLEDNKLEPEQLTGTGAGGRITKQDVEAYLARPREESKKTPEPVTEEKVKPQPAVKPAAIPADMPGQLIPHTSTRRQIATHMVDSVLTSPRVLTVMEVDMTKVLAHRKANKEKYEQDGVNLTLTAYFIAALAKALGKHKIVNASWTDEGIFAYTDVNVGMAVALGEGGLIVPVIRQAQNLSLMGIAAQINDLAERARNKKLKPDEVKGGTFTLTNHGTAGSLFAMPIINQPQLGILGTGMMQKRAIVVTDENGNDSIAIRPMVYLSYVFDHRAVDGESGDNFLMDVKKILENWSE
ncbi:MAG: dihydrolipoamide acetyltransferase family protein [Anaerolineaceae bacterium]|jgi:2-oxoglutarate dehydrogenase E2 component (dihydrolipoamide succinyltransferase)